MVVRGWVDECYNEVNSVELPGLFKKFNESYYNAYQYWPPWWGPSGTSKHGDMLRGL
jgi:hypothetical protein